MGTAPAISVARPRWFAASGRLARQLFSFPVFLGALLVAGIFFGARIQGVQGDLLFSEGDTWWHLRAGEDILRNHALPRVDTYSATAHGTDWIAYEWLGEVAMAAAYRADGLAGVKWLNLGLASALLLLLYCHATQRSGNSKSAFIVSAICMPVLLGFCTMRPQMLGWIFFLLTLICIERFQQGDNWALCFLPVIFLLWVNTHGTFIFGLLVLFFTWLSAHFQFERGGIVSTRWDARRRRIFAAATLACFLVLPLTPYGTRLASYPLEMALNQPLNVASIQEWLPVASQRLLSVEVLILLVGFFFSILFGSPRCRLAELLMVLTCALGAALHLRLAIIFLFGVVPLIATGLRNALPGYARDTDHPAWNAIMIFMLLLGAALRFPSEARLVDAMSIHYPVRALQYLHSHPVRGPIFHEYGWGGYLILNHALPAGVFIDGRADLYERAGTLRDYLSIARLEPNAMRVIEKHNLQAFLIQSNSALATTLDASPKWQCVYRDDLSAIFLRRPAANHLNP